MSRKYFGTDGVRGLVGKFPITVDFALQLGWAAGKALFKPGKKNIAMVGKDSRQSGDMLEAALIAGLTSAGVDVVSLGILPTPGIAEQVKKNEATMGIIISASHNPFYDNGIKFFSSSAEKLSDSEEELIESYIDKELEIVSAENIGTVNQNIEASNSYADFCLSKINKALVNSKLKVVVDCANGATSTVAPIVFNSLNLNAIFINHEPNGLNINLKSGAVHLESLQKKVLDETADFGIAYDGDGDRIMLINSEGKVLDGDDILYIIADFHQQQGHLDGGVVGTLMTNFGLEKSFESKNIPFVRSNVGDRYVMELLKEKKWRIGGESSGHIICLDANTTGDGIIASLKILEIVSITGMSLNKLLQGVKKTPQIMINVPVKNKIKPTDLDKLKPDILKIENLLAKSGRVLLRPSGTEPVLRVMVEAINKIDARNYANILADVVKKLFS
ncbi:MAG: phosphoglucosamine mutase [Francisellaceae bacterium]